LLRVVAIGSCELDSQRNSLPDEADEAEETAHFGHDQEPSLKQTTDWIYQTFDNNQVISSFHQKRYSFGEFYGCKGRVLALNQAAMGDYSEDFWFGVHDF